MNKTIRWTIVVIASLAIVKCSTVSFYSQAIGGQLHLMHQRQAIQRLLNSNDTDPGLKGQLQKVMGIRRFASQSLGLPENNSYSSYVATGSDAVVWNVIATPADSLQALNWCFPVAGCVPYRGYFKKDKAGAFADKLAQKGLDVAVLPATAYSTLGWFDDPVLDTMLRYPDFRLAELIFHELAHQLIYKKGDADFNESFATLVARSGVKRWLSAQADPAQITRWQQYQEDQDIFNQLLAQSRKELEHLYASPPDGESLYTEKQHVINRLRDRYRAKTSRTGKQNGYAAWLDQPLNNAYFALHATYENGVGAFACLLNQHHDEFESFYIAAEEISRWPAEKRSTWLKEGWKTHCATEQTMRTYRRIDQPTGNE